MSKIIWNPLKFESKIQTNKSLEFEILTVPPNKSEIQELKNKIEAKSILPLNMYVMLTYDCNLSCDYCYVAEQRSTSKNSINIDSAKKAIRTYVNWLSNNKNYNGEEIRILLFGGEPGKAKLELVELLKFLTQDFNNVSPILFTNGYSLEDEILNIIDGTKTHIVVSIDGPPWLSEQTRKPALGNSIIDINKRLKKLSDINVSWEIDIVLSPMVLNHLTEVISYLNSFKPNFIGANIMTGLSGKYTPEKSITLEAYTSLILAHFHTLIENDVKVYQIWSQYTSFKNKIPNIEYMCEMVGDKTVLDVNSQLVPCEFFIGSNFKLDNLNEYLPLSKKLKKKHPIYNKNCLSCHSLGICSGGCTFLSDKEGRGLFRIDNATCYFNKRFGEMLIKESSQNGYSI